MKLICPFRTGGKFCTHIGNKNLTRSRRKCKCIYSLKDCPYLNYIKEKTDVVSNTK